MPIQNRPGVRGSLAEKFVEIFNWYEGDLDEVQQMYERDKVLFILLFLCSVCLVFMCIFN